jgi:hypothetical protein
MCSMPPITSSTVPSGSRKANAMAWPGSPPGAVPRQTTKAGRASSDMIWHFAASIKMREKKPKHSGQLRRTQPRDALTPGEDVPTLAFGQGNLIFDNFDPKQKARFVSWWRGGEDASDFYQGYRIPASEARP